MPEDTEIKAVLELLNPEHIQLDDEQQTVHLFKKGMEIDLGAIAKGYFADQVMSFFKKNGVTSAMVDMGGNVLVHGDSPTGSNHWKVGIQNPFYLEEMQQHSLVYGSNPSLHQEYTREF